MRLRTMSRSLEEGPSSFAKESLFAIADKVRIPRVFVQPFRLNPYTRSEGFRTPQPGSVL